MPASKAPGPSAVCKVCPRIKVGKLWRRVIQVHLGILYFHWITAVSLQLPRLNVMRLPPTKQPFSPRHLLLPSKLAFPLNLFLHFPASTVRMVANDISD